MKHSYTYEIQQVDIVNGTVNVKYTPVDTNLLAISYSIAACVSNEDGSVMSLRDIILCAAPHDKWSAQDLLRKNYDELNGKTELVSADAA